MGNNNNWDLDLYMIIKADQTHFFDSEYTELFIPRIWLNLFKRKKI